MAEQAKIRRLSRPLAALAVAAALAGCSNGQVITNPGAGMGVERESAMHADTVRFYDEDAKIQELAKEDFSLKLIRFQDKRAPEYMADPIGDDIIHNFVPDKLLRGVQPFMTAQLERYFRFGPPRDTTYFVELDLTGLRTMIGTGSFSSGPYGEYLVLVKAHLVVRDRHSTVLLQTPVEVKLTEGRKPIDGLHPSSDMDRRAISKLAQQAVRDLAIKTGWFVRKHVD